MLKRVWWPCTRPVMLVALLCVLRWSQARAFITSSAGALRTTTAGKAEVYGSQMTVDLYNYRHYLSDGYNSTYNMVYKRLNWGSYKEHKAKAPYTYDTIVMENDYLQLTVVPGIGGRIYSCVFKPTGNNEFYSNAVVKPTPWGPPEQGWWLAAGGMEWCLPVDEHGYEWGILWDATTRTEANGVTVVLTDTERTDRLRAVITLHLADDRSHFSVTPRIENPTPDGIWYKYWTNAQVAPGPQNNVSADLRFVLPTDQVTVHSSGYLNKLPAPGQAMSWPIYKGRDWSRLGNWETWLGFFARPAATRGFQGVYDDAADEGLARVFPPDVARGAKGFAWGWEHKHPPIWTDGVPEYYAEIHGGIAPTFWGSTYLPPGGAIQWTEHWYPVAGIGGLTAATAEAALNLRISGTQVTIGVQPTTPQPEGTVALWRPGEAAPLQRTVISLTPASPYKTTLAPEGDLNGLILVYLDGAGSLLATTDPTPETQPPSARVDDLPPHVPSTDLLAVSWSGSDGESCVLDYDVQYKDGYDGAWTDWLTRTTFTSAVFDGGEHGHTYFFRSRARDLYGNLGPYGDEEWGQAFSSVLASPTPVLVTSRKWLDQLGATGGDVLTYTLSMRNTGNDDAHGVTLTDTLPAEVTLIPDTLRSSDGSPVTYARGEIRWQGTIAQGDVTEITFAARVLPDVTPDLRPVYNTMRIGHQGAVLTRHTSFVLGHCTFFPLTCRSSP